MFPSGAEARDRESPWSVAAFKNFSHFSECSESPIDCVLEPCLPLHSLLSYPLPATGALHEAHQCRIAKPLLSMVKESPLTTMASLVWADVIPSTPV